MSARTTKEAITECKRLALRGWCDRETLDDAIGLLREGMTAADLWERLCCRVYLIQDRMPAKIALMALGYEGDYLIDRLYPGDPMPGVAA